MKKAQIQFTETIFVLFILMIIISIGVILTFLFYTRSFSEKKEEIVDIDVVTLTGLTINLPEFTCGTTKNCIDSLKIHAFQNILNDPVNKQHYSKFFDKKRITLEIIYPKTDEKGKKCEETMIGDANYPKNCGWFLIYGEDTPPEFSKKLENFVKIYFPTLNKEAIGLLKIEVFE